MNLNKKNGEENRRIIIGGVISGLTLLGLIGFSSSFTNSYLFFFIYFAPWIIPLLFLGLFPLNIIIPFSVNIYGLRLIFSSINPRSKGFFLLIYGYLLFAFNFLIQPPINYESLKNVPLLFLFVDVPIFIMIIFGFYNICNFKKYTISDKIYFVPVILYNILSFLVFPFVMI